MDYPHFNIPSFPLLTFTTPHDLFTHLPTSTYDPSVPLLPIDFARTVFCE